MLRNKGARAAVECVEALVSKWERRAEGVVKGSAVSVSPSPQRRNKR